MRIWRTIRHQRWGAGLALALAMVVGFGVPFGDASSSQAAFALQTEFTPVTETSDRNDDPSTQVDLPTVTTPSEVRETSASNNVELNDEVFHEDEFPSEHLQEPGGQENIVFDDSVHDSHVQVMQNDETKSPGAVETDAEPEVQAIDEDLPGGVSLLAMPTGRNYLTWDVRDAAGNPVGGATVQVEGPRSSSSNWNFTYNVADCTSDPCHPLSMDQDPRPGFFAVAKLTRVTGTGTLTTHDVSASNRYRMRSVGSIIGYNWSDSNSWIEIPGLSWPSSANTPSGWPQSGPWNFGTLRVAQRAQTDFCAAENTLHRYYSLRRAGTGATTSRETSIVRVSHNAAETTINTGASAVPNSAVTVPTGQIANGLGVTPTGVFYFASQDSDALNEVTTYRFDPLVDSEPYPVFTMDLLSPTSGWIVAGDATIYQGNEEFYYAYYSLSRESINNREALRMHVYRYSAGNGARTGEVAHVDVERPANFTDQANAMNGDFAFDAQNNLQFIMSDTSGGYTVAGVVDSNAIHSLPGNHVVQTVPTISATANSGRLPAGQRDAINGVTYTQGGRAIIQQGNLNAFADPATLTIFGSRTTVTTSGVLVDLASCAEPTTITVQKNLVGERFASADQFILNASRSAGSTTSAFQSVTTSGVATGVQSQQLGPYPMIFDGRFYASEEVTQHGANYVSGYACYIQRPDGTVEEDDPFIEGSGRELEFDLSTTTDPRLVSGSNILCVFTNQAIKPAEVRLAKLVKNVGETEAKPAGGWTLNTALAGAQTGVTIEDPVTNVTAEADGYVAEPWNIIFTDLDQSANLNISETIQAGYSFESLRCDITSDIDEDRTVELEDASATLNGVRPGDQVDCTFTNVQEPGSVTWHKVDGNDALLAGSEWKLTYPNDTEETIVDCVGSNDPNAEVCAIDTDPQPGRFTIEHLPWGQYTLVETRAPAGYFIDPTPHQFTINASTLNYEFDTGFVNVQREAPDLPLTGGLGRDFYTLLGLSILVLGGGAAAVIRIRNRRKEVA